MIAVLAVALAALQDGADERPWRATLVELDERASRVALRDVDADGRLDLLEVGRAGLRLRVQTDSGMFEPAGELLAWPSDHLGWCLADLDGDGGVEVVSLSADGVVTTRAAGSAGFAEARVVLESRCYLPHGVNRVGFARDVDGDGRTDLVLPGSGTYRIHLQDAEGGFAAAIEVAFDVRVSYRVGDPDALDASFGQTVRVPWFGIEDVDGDGRADLVARTSERVDFYLARPDLPAEPTWRLDLEALEREIPSKDEVDLDDLLSNVELGVQYELAELDGRAPRDLVLQLGGTVKVYLGGSVRGVTERPDQVLKISGNLLQALVRDTDGDGAPDLQLLRGDRVSLGRALRWLILPGTLDFELFTYANEGGAFSRRPTRRNTVRLEIPRLLSLFDEIEAVEEEIERQQAVPARRIDLEGAGDAGDDVVDLEDGGLVFFAGCAPPLEDDLLRAFRDGDVEQGFQDLVLDDLDRAADGEVKVIDVGDLDTWTYAPGAALRASRAGREPVLRVPLALEDAGEPAIVVTDLDGDGGGDVVVWSELPGGGWRVQLVVLGG